MTSLGSSERVLARNNQVHHQATNERKRKRTIDQRWNNRYEEREKRNLKDNQPATEHGNKEKTWEEKSDSRDKKNKRKNRRLGLVRTSKCLHDVIKSTKGQSTDDKTLKQT